MFRKTIRRKKRKLIIIMVLIKMIRRTLISSMNKTFNFYSFNRVCSEHLYLEDAGEEPFAVSYDLLSRAAPSCAVNSIHSPVGCVPNTSLAFFN